MSISNITVGKTRIQSSEGVPSHASKLGALYINTTNGDYYKNIDGNTSWELFGEGGGGTPNGVVLSKFDVITDTVASNGNNPQKVSCFGDINFSTGASWVSDSDGVTIPNDGYYELSLAIKMQSTGQRTTDTALFAINDNVLTEEGTNSYIRNSSFINTASIVLTTVVYCNQGDIISVYMKRIGNVGNVSNIQPEGSMISITQLSAPGETSDYSVTESDVTQYESALTITQSQISDLSTFSGDYNDLTNQPPIPTDNSELANGAGYITSQRTDAEIQTIITNNTEGFIKDYTVTESDVTQYESALNITQSQISDLSTFSGDYNDLINQPPIPTDNIDLANGAGYITSFTDTQRTDEEIRDISSAQWVDGTNTIVIKDDAGDTIKINSTDTQRTDAEIQTIITNNTEGFIKDYTVTESDVTQYESALNITQSQISDLSVFSGDYNDLTNQPPIPTDNIDLANGAGYITSFTDTFIDGANLDSNILTLTNNLGNDVIKIEGGNNVTIIETSTNEFSISTTGGGGGTGGTDKVFSWFMNVT